MLPLEARRIIEALAQGVNPETEEVLPQDSLLQRASRLVRLGRIKERAEIYVRGAAVAQQRAPS